MTYQNPDTQQYRDKVDIRVIFNNQVQRCLQAMDTEYFQNSVEALARLLPTASFLRLEKRKGEWCPTTEKLVYEYSGPIKLGSETQPLMDKAPDGERYPIPYTTDEDGNRVIDWDDPHILSPRFEEVESPDYMLFFRFILEEAEDVGLTWKSEPLNSEYGLYPEIEEDLGTPTPLDDPKKNESPEPNPLHQICWINYKGKPKRVTNFRGYACGIDPGEKPWFFTEIAHRQKKQEPIVILITATQGKGKTYFGIRLAEIFDKRFEPQLQIAMDRSQITKLVSGRANLRRNQVILIDESQFGANARSWGNKDQQALMNFLAAARFYGYIIIIVALHRKMLDSIIRERIINFHIHMEDRGLATCYETIHARFDENIYPTRKGQIMLQLPDYDACDHITCLTCKKKETCGTIRAQYERIKTEFVQEEAETQDQKEQIIAEKNKPYNTFDEVVNQIADIKYEIPRKANGTIHQGNTVTWLKQKGFKVRYDDWAALVEELRKIYG